MPEMYQDCFLGASSGDGFLSYFDTVAKDTDIENIYILKGTPGSGKSSLMKRLASYFMDNGCTVELIHCASDPCSLDGVICSDRSFAIFDGTAPHIIEPRYPLAHERTVNILDCIDTDGVRRHSEEIIALSDSLSEIHSKNSRVLEAVATIKSESEALLTLNTLYERIERFVYTQTKYFSETHKKSKKSFRLLDAVTPDGAISLAYPYAKNYMKTTVICDPYGAAVHAILALMEQKAIECGLDVIASPNPLNPKKTEHLFIPELSRCYLSSRTRSKCMAGDVRFVHFERFTDDQYKKKKNLLSFNERLVKSLIEMSAEIMDAARKEHSKLEALYTPHVDFSAVHALERRIIDSL